MRIVNPPKDALKLVAENLAVFEKHRDMWSGGGNLLYADYRNGTYEAAALFFGKVVFMQFTVPEEKEGVESDQEIPESD